MRNVNNEISVALDNTVVIIITSAFKAWFVTMWIQTFDFGGTFEKHFALTSPYAAMQCRNEITVFVTLRLLS